MIAAIYARKSTDQAGIADDQKSVARQIQHAREYSSRKGWIVPDEHIYVDDGISGAEFANRPGFTRLMNALRPRPPFEVLVMSEDSRLGREAIETSYALKRLLQAGVQVWLYLEDKQRTLDRPIDKVMQSLTAFSDESERERTRQRTYDALARKAKLGHVTGGRCFGYRNVPVMTAEGERSHVVYEVHNDEAAVVRQIFSYVAQGSGLKAIAKQLNESGALAPKRRGRPAAWAPSSIREVLHRELYRGRRVWNVTKKRDSWGQDRRTERPAHEWFSIDVPHLRIVPEPLWNAVHECLSGRAKAYRVWCDAGKPEGRFTDGRGLRTRHFLTGFGRCMCCGGSMLPVASGKAAQGRRVRYMCSMYWNRGTSVCANGRPADMRMTDDAIAAVLAKEVLTPNRLERAIDRAVAMLRGDDRDSRRAALERELRTVETALANLTETAASGGAVPAVLDALVKREDDRVRLRAELERLGSGVPSVSERSLKSNLRAYVDRWSDVLSENRTQARALLGVALDDRIGFEPVSDGGYRLHVPIAFDKLLIAAVPAVGQVPDFVVTRAGIEPAAL